MLGINVTYIMKPGERKSFLSELAASGVRETIRAEAGCLQYDYFLAAGDPDILLLLEKWTDRDAQAAHMTQPHMARLAAMKERWVSETKLETYEL